MFSFVFLAVAAFIGVMFLAVMGVIMFVATKGVSQWSHNNQQPVLTAPVRVVGKRTDTTGMSGSSVSTWYHATFEFPSGERREFSVGGPGYGLLAEGDHGTLTFQGTRFHRFERAA